MIAEKRKNGAPSRRKGRILPWLNLLLAVILVALGIWYLSGRVSLSEVVAALLLANSAYIALSVLVMLATVLLKGWRWQLMFFTREEAPPFAPIFWALMLGQYVNLIVPFLRLGEVARIYALKQETEIAMARALGTLVVEKVLDAIMLVLTLAVIIPFVILPEFIGEPGFILWTVPLAALLVLYLLAYQTELITRFFRSFTARLPARLGGRFLGWSVAGLEGLGALRNRRLALLLVLSSALIAALAVLLPYVLFGAFDLPLGLVQAALIHIAVTLVTTPPSTPGKLGVFNGVAALMLVGYGLSDNAVIVSYSIVYYLVVIVPQIILGSIAASKTGWRWQKTVDENAPA